MKWKQRVLAATVLGTLVGSLKLVLLPPQWLFTRVAAPLVCPGAVYAVDTSAKVVALTIDDGPDLRVGDANSTDRILAVLKRHNQAEPQSTAHATFFLLSDQVQRREGLGNGHQDEITAQIVADGHEIGNHLVEDGASILLGDRFTPAFDSAHHQLAAYTNVSASEHPQVRWLRPGVGWCDRDMTAAIAQHAAYRSDHDFPHIALGSVWPYDTFQTSPAFSRWFIRRSIRPGSIIILHDSGARGDRTVAVLSQLLPALAEAGYKVVPLSELATYGQPVAPSQELPNPLEAVRQSGIIWFENRRAQLKNTR